MSAELRVPSDDDFEECVGNSERLAWTVDQVLPVGRALDFSRPFLPEALVHLEQVPLPPDDKRMLNHIRAHAYVSLFIFVEEYIVATAMRHAQAEQFGSPAILRAFLRFADEEIKHQQLFRRFQDAFARGFPHRCDVLDNAVEVAGYILSKPAISVLLVTLQLELITQQHYVQAIGPHGDVIEPSFRSMFEHHWLEESQHVRIDVLELARLAADTPPEDVAAALDAYEEIVAAFDELLGRQAGLDLATLERATGRSLGDDRPQLVRQVHASYRQDFLHDGFANPSFVRVLRKLHPDGPRRLEQLAARFR
jgi:hypothetical protein